MKSKTGRPRSLTDSQVALIMAWHAERKAAKTLRDLAKELGVPPATVYAVIRRQGEFKQLSPDQREPGVRERIAGKTAAKRK